jgi:glycosyltransferase involved in cell wall biosynthesis
VAHSRLLDATFGAGHHRSVRISAVIITKDEEDNIGRCLESLRGVVDDVLVMDSGSTDRTESIARDSGARFVLQPWLGYGPQKNAASDAAQEEWILSLDADEALSDELRASILAVKGSEPDADAYEMNRLNWYCGRFMRHSGWYPDRKVRLWRKGAARWSDAIVHEVVEPAPGARVRRLAGDLLHYTCYTREQHLRTIEKFTTLSAQELARDGRGGGALRRFASPIAQFLRGYVLKLGFLDGAEGYQACRLSAYATWLKYEKLRRLREDAVALR